MSYVVSYPEAEPQAIEVYYAAKLAAETDCADVHQAMANDDVDFVLLHVIGTAEAFAARHIPRAIHLPHREITADIVTDWPVDTLFVVYCAGPHCNGADQAAFKLARLGCKVKVMIGGLTGWADEGFAFAKISC